MHTVTESLPHKQGSEILDLRRYVAGRVYFLVGSMTIMPLILFGLVERPGLA